MSFYPNGIPDKGKVLTGLSTFWFNYTESVADNHLITTAVEDYPDVLQPDADLLKGRSMLVRKADRVDVECVCARLSRRVWLVVVSEKPKKSVDRNCPPRITRVRPAPRTPLHTDNQGRTGRNTTKPITIEEMRDQIGSELTDRLIDASFELFRAASQHAESAGIILCDTKFEFGQRDGKLIVIDEVFHTRLFPFLARGTSTNRVNRSRVSINSSCGIISPKLVGTKKPPCARITGDRYL